MQLNARERKNTCMMGMSSLSSFEVQQKQQTNVNFTMTVEPQLSADRMQNLLLPTLATDRSNSLINCSLECQFYVSSDGDLLGGSKDDTIIHHLGFVFLMPMMTICERVGDMFIGWFLCMVKLSWLILHMYAEILRDMLTL